METQRIPKITTTKVKRIRVGGKLIEIKPTQPGHPGKSQQVILKKLKEAGRKKAFPSLEVNA